MWVRFVWFLAALCVYMLHVYIGALLCDRFLLLLKEKEYHANLKGLPEKVMGRTHVTLKIKSSMKKIS